VQQSAKSVVPSDVIDLSSGAVRQWPQGSGLAEAAVRPVTVVMRELAERCYCMLLIPDQDAVEELAAKGTDEAFGDGWLAVPVPVSESN
jgi:hypothetical protein